MAHTQVLFKYPEELERERERERERESDTVSTCLPICLPARKNMSASFLPQPPLSAVIMQRRSESFSEADETRGEEGIWEHGKFIKGREEKEKDIWDGEMGILGKTARKKWQNEKVK